MKREKNEREGSLWFVYCIVVGGGRGERGFLGAGFGGGGRGGEGEGGGSGS